MAVKVRVQELVTLEFLVAVVVLAERVLLVMIVPRFRVTAVMAYKTI